MSGLAYAPPGVARSVRAPGTPDWERDGHAYLLDCVRRLPPLSGPPPSPIVLAQFARHFVTAQAQAAQDGLADARTGLQAHVGPAVVEEAAQAWLEQAAQLARTRRAVALIDDALRVASTCRNSRSPQPP